MTSSHGYFVHVRTGEVIPIHEHASSVVECPEQYGLTGEEVAGLSASRDRREILEAALLQGFIRVRHTTHFVSIEFMTQWLETLECIAQALDEMQIGEICWLQFNQLATGESMEIATYGLRQHYESGKTLDLLRRVEMRTEE